MPGREIIGRSKIANYRHGGRAGYKEGKKVVAGEPPELPVPLKLPKAKKKEAK